MDLMEIPRSMPQFGKSMRNLLRTRNDVFGVDRESSCKCGGGCGCEGDGGCECECNSTKEDPACKVSAFGRLYNTHPSDRCQTVGDWHGPKRAGSSGSWQARAGVGGETGGGGSQSGESATCQALLDCYKEWAKLNPKSDRANSNFCLYEQVAQRRTGQDCPSENNGLDNAGAKCGDSPPLSKGELRACHYGDRRIDFWPCWWHLRCVCAQFWDSEGGMCMRGCLDCLRNHSMDLGYDGHAWCRTRCKDVWRKRGDGPFPTDDDELDRVIRNCVKCNEGTVQAHAILLVKHGRWIWEAL